MNLTISKVGVTSAFRQGMRRLSSFFFLFLFTLACAKSTGFKASDYDYRRAEKLAETQPKPQTAPQKWRIERDSHRIQFTPTETDWTQPSKVILKAQVKVDGDSLGEIEFIGTKVDSRIHLRPVDPELNDKLQAQLICLSDEGTCTEFFIDVFYKENGIYFHDQILARPKTESAPAPKTQEPKGNSTTAPAAPKTNPNPGTPANSRPPQPPRPSEPLIADEISDLEIHEDAGFVGTPDEEVQELFNPPAAKKEEPVTPKKKESPQKESAPEKQPVPKGSPSKEPNPVKEKEPSGQKEAKDQGRPTESPPTSANQGTAAMEVLERFRASDQAINSPSKGRLEKGTDLFQVAQAANFGFQVTKAVGTKDYYSTFGLARTIAKIAEGLKEILPDRILYVTALSRWGGGFLSPHKSHQNGTDADVRYLRNDERMGSLVVDSKGRLSSNFLAAPQWKLFKKAFETKNIEMIFVGPAIKRAMCEEARRSGDYKTGDQNSAGAEMLKRLVIEPNHNDHFHIRVRCTDRRCSRITYKYRAVGCS